MATYSETEPSENVIAAVIVDEEIENHRVNLAHGRGIEELETDADVIAAVLAVAKWGNRDQRHRITVVRFWYVHETEEV